MAGLNKYQAYPEYKDSGVEWLGEIPSHWNTKRLGQFFEERREKVSDKDFPALSVTMQGILPQLETVAKTDAGDNRKLVLKNDFVINSRSDRKGSAGVSRFDGSVSLISIVMQPKKINVSFTHHLLRSYPFQEEFYRYGKGIVADLWSTNSSEMKNILLPEIPDRESGIIAKFLDHETAKIDNLIEKQQQLIELLKEKRQAVISHAVTKGLNPDEPMQDSSAEWLGKKPEYWEVKSLKHVLKAIGDVDHYMPKSVDEGIPYVMTGDLLGFASKIKFEQCKHVSRKDYLSLSKRIKCSYGDVIMARYATIGAVSYIDLNKEFLVSYSCVTIKPDTSKVLGLYLYYYFQSNSFSQGIQYQINTNTQGNVGIADLIKIKTIFPSIDEQRKIINKIQSNLNKLDKLSNKSLQAIALMQERRTALISAAVTGKIDVRNWVAPASETETLTEAYA